MKKSILATAMAGITLATAFMFACKKDETVYDAGEYGTVDAAHDVKANPGYKFIGWSDPVKSGNKTVYTAQYLHREYYLSEVKDVYVFEQGEWWNEGASVKYKTTNIQTGEVDYEILSHVLQGCVKITSFPSGEVYNSGGKIQIRPTKEYDFMVTATVDDDAYNINQEFTLHCVMNRIPAESIEIRAISHEIELGKERYFSYTVLPENTSFDYCVYKVVRVVRGGVDLPEEEAAEVAYFDYRQLKLGEGAQVDDVIWVQAENERDPEIKSQLWAVTVV